MLKLTRHDPPYDSKSIWISAFAITALEQGDGCTVIWMDGAKSHLVTQPAGKVLEMIAEAKRRAREAAAETVNVDTSMFGSIFGPR